MRWRRYLVSSTILVLIEIFLDRLKLMLIAAIGVMPRYSWNIPLIVIFWSQYFFGGLEYICWPLLCLCTPFMIFEGCLDSNTQFCYSKRALQLSHPYLYLATYHSYCHPVRYLATHPSTFSLVPIISHPCPSLKILKDCPFNNARHFKGTVFQKIEWGLVRQLKNLVFWIPSINVFWLKRIRYNKKKIWNITVSLPSLYLNQIPWEPNPSHATVHLSLCIG